MNPELIEKAEKDGHAIATRLKNAKTVAEVDALKNEIDAYADFVNENFGSVDEFSETNERHCELSFYLYIAAETKERHLNYTCKGHNDYSNEDIDVFEEYLDSKEWIENSTE